MFVGSGKCKEDHHILSCWPVKEKINIKPDN